MKTIVFVLLQVILASGILYGYYHLMLRNKKFHQYNRFYLLASVIISVLIPFLNIPVYFEETEIQSSVVLQTLQTISSSSPENETIITSGPVSAVASTPFDWNIVLYFFYWLAASLLFIRILVSLKKIIAIIKNNPVEYLNGIRFINTVEPGTPYSFFRWLFWNKKIELRSEKGEQIFRHEIFHIQQKHTLDIIFMELLTVAFWINPFFHLVKKEIKTIHEFLADQFAAHKTEKWEYAELLLMQALNTQQQLVNPFFHNQIKRRIAMITNPKKTSHRYLRKLLVLPVAAIVLILFAFKYKNKAVPDAMKSDQPITIVIDAGHGGTDAGVMSPDNKYSEAQISLEIAKQIQSLAKEYNVNVIMTREDDKFPGNAANNEDGLKKRVEIANKIKPDAFIAIHVNAAYNGPRVNQTNYSGFEAYVSGKREDTKGMLLASAILKNLAPVYKTSLQLKQRKVPGVYVLDHNSYPAVHLECGYINNLEDLAFITNKENQEKIARNILEGIINYKNSLGGLNESSLPEEITNSATINGNIEIAAIDSVNSNEPSKITINGKEFSIKKLTIEDMENTKITAADLRISRQVTGSDTTYPLIVVDGVKQEMNSNLASIDPASIESLNVWKGKTAIAKYGPDGKNGVIEIFTRKIKEIVLQDKPGDQDISEVKAMAWREGKAAYVYKGRTYVFGRITNPDPRIAFFTEQNGTNHVFLVNGELIHSVDELNKRYSRNDIKAISLISPEESLRRFNINGAIVSIETFDKEITKNSGNDENDKFSKDQEWEQATKTNTLSFDQLKRATIHNLFRLAEGTEIISYKFTMEDGKDILEVPGKGDKFNSSMVAWLDKMIVPSLVTFEEVRVMKDGREMKIPSRFFYVTKSISQYTP